ncbi:hypothetical protein VF12_37020 [Nostoc linckia z15]|nr:hypothetical protein VF12_37020 [Nostoc linckia z15]
MKKMVFLALLLSILKLDAQNLDFIKSQDTLFIVGHCLTSVTTTKHTYAKLEMTRHSNGIVSVYILHDKDSVHRNIYMRVALSPKMPLEDLPITVNRKKFLRARKSEFIDFDTIGKYTIEEFFFKYLELDKYQLAKKNVYIIDEESLKRKDKKLVLRKTSIFILGMRI